MVLYASTGKIHEDEGNTISRDEYAKGNTLFGFDMTLDMSEVGPFQLIKQDNLRVIHFTEALAETYSDPVLSHSMVWIRVSHKGGRYA
jgi:hypothetical protein